MATLTHTQREMLPVHIRWMIRRDMPEVLQTEQESFEYAWTEEDFLKCLRQRNCIGMVAEHNEKVIGFMIYELHKAKLHVLNFAVHPDYRRQGVGRQVVAMLARKLSSHRRTRLTAVLADHNLAGHLFFRACGFRSVRVLRDYFTTPPADGYLMRYKIPSSARRSEP
jgi:[ribosomal protein S18]-alanine N-acetyltransferase